MENKTRVLGVLSGADLDASLLRQWASSAHRVLAADAGADRLLEVGSTPHVVVGDFDSVAASTLNAVGDSRQEVSQEITDCDKLLGLAVREGYRKITLAGVEGDLPDHVLATLHSAARAPLDIRLAYRRGVGWIVSPECPRQVQNTESGRRVSLLPIVACAGVTLTNVAWPLQDASLAVTGMTSISNRATASAFEATVREGAALLFVEYPPAEMPFWDA